MRIRIREPEDFISGLIFVTIGFGAMAIALGYPMGTAARMGPGYLPALLGGLLGALGAAIMFKSLDFAAVAREREAWRPDLWQAVVRVLRPLIVIAGGLIAFSYLLPRYGLVAAVVALVLIITFADYKPRYLLAVPLAVGLAAVAVLIFVRGLGIPMRVWP
jgi:hypothetical protein